MIQNCILVSCTLFSFGVRGGFVDTALPCTQKANIYEPPWCWVLSGDTGRGFPPPPRAPDTHSFFLDPADTCPPKAMAEKLTKYERRAAQRLVQQARAVASQPSDDTPAVSELMGAIRKTANELELMILAERMAKLRPTGGGEKSKSDFEYRVNKRTHFLAAPNLFPPRGLDT